jgi:hypothetical protein
MNLTLQGARGRPVANLRARIEAGVTLSFDLSPADLEIFHAPPVPS